MKSQNLLVIPILLVCFGLSPQTQAVVPAPDGGYPGGNTAEGQNALLSLTSGTYNTAIGLLSLRSDTSGSYNTGVGAGALFVNNTGNENTATGFGALLSNTTGIENTANGAFALFSNTTANFNTATGSAALLSNTTGGLNTAIGSEALTSNTIGDSNTATGSNALNDNTAGHLNTAIGLAALAINTVGNRNTAAGALALFNTTADENTAVGYHALQLHNDATGNTAVGSFALEHSTGRNNTADGFGALAGNTSGSNNVALGNNAGGNLTTGDNNIDIGNNVIGMAGEADTIRIGNTNITDTYIRGISGATVAGGAAVFVDSNGHLGALTSSARFKDEIKPMGNASETILALRPVSFRYKKQIDPQGIPEFGLIAEEVEKVNPGLITRDPEGKPYTVRYEQINAMLLNEFLKEHRIVQELQATVQKQEAIIAQQQKSFQSEFVAQEKRLETVTDGLERLSAQLELTKSRSQTALNNP
jgi:hypothetical protein